MIGAPRVLNPWTTSPVVTEAMQSERDEALTFGIPASWVQYVHFSGYANPESGATIRMPQLGIGGQYPARSIEELKLAVNLGLGLDLQLPAGFDLIELRDVFAIATSLSIGTPVGGLVGWAALESAQELRLLRVGAPTEPLNLAELPNLVSFIGMGAHAARVVTNPRLRDLTLDISRWPKGLSVAAPLRRLVLESARGVTSLPLMTSPNELKVFIAYQCRSFDVGSLLCAPNLELVDLYARELLNVGALAKFEKLKTVDLEGVRHMPDPDSLKLIAAPHRVRVSDHAVISERLRAELISSKEVEWQISEPKPSDEDLARKRFTFDEDVDAITFAPFAVRDAPEGGAYLLVLKLQARDGVTVAPSAAAAIIRDEISAVDSGLLRSERANIIENETEIVVDFVSLAELQKVVMRVAKLWNHPTQLSDRARFAAPNSDAVFN